MNKYIKLNTEYYLDLGSLTPIKIKTLSFLSNGVKCEYLNSYSNRIGILDYELFKMNGFTIKK